MVLIHSDHDFAFANWMWKWQRLRECLWGFASLRVKNNSGKEETIHLVVGFWGQYSHDLELKEEWLTFIVGAEKKWPHTNSLSLSCVRFLRGEKSIDSRTVFPTSCSANISFLRCCQIGWGGQSGNFFGQALGQWVLLKDSSYSNIQKRVCICASLIFSKFLLPGSSVPLINICNLLACRSRVN